MTGNRDGIVPTDVAPQRTGHCGALPENGLNSSNGRACSSVVEHGAHNPRVAGSNPAGPTKSANMSSSARQGTTFNGANDHSIGHRT